MSDIHYNHESTISIDGRLLNNVSKYGMEMSADKSKVMVNTCKGNHTDFYLCGSKLEEVVQF